MANLRLTLSALVLTAAASLTLSCGASSAPQHELESITLSPMTADANPQGQAQFTATGYYTTAPLVVTPLPATWGACYELQPTTAVSVSATGLAQCASGAEGTFTVWANDPITTPGTYSCPAQTACGGGCTVQATALLTCP